MLCWCIHYHCQMLRPMSLGVATDFVTDRCIISVSEVSIALTWWCVRCLLGWSQRCVVHGCVWKGRWHRDDQKLAELVNFLLKHSEKKVVFSIFSVIPDLQREEVVPSSTWCYLQKSNEGQPIRRRQAYMRQEWKLLVSDSGLKKGLHKAHYKIPVWDKYFFNHLKVL